MFIGNEALPIDFLFDIGGGTTFMRHCVKINDVPIALAEKFKLPITEQLFSEKQKFGFSISCL